MRNGKCLVMGLLLLFAGICTRLHSQVIGTWNFNSSIAGVAGPLNSVTAADFSAAVGSTAFNASMEYYGHNGWPTGALDPAVYIQFTLTPNTGYALNINSLILRLRHSNTGSSGGSGPKQFSVRSSVDAFTSDIATGSVSAAYANHNINTGPAITSYIGPVTFRVYGYMSVLYSGGNNRFVFDNIEVSSIGIILPVKLLSFTAQSLPGEVAISYSHENAGFSGTTAIERSVNGIDFAGISSAGNDGELIVARFTDDQLPLYHSLVYYRLKIEQATGEVMYSKIITIPIQRSPRNVQAYLRGSTLVVAGRLSANTRIVLVNGTGSIIFSRMLPATGAGQVNSLSLPSRPPTGIYHIALHDSRTREVIPVFQEQ